MSLSVSAYSSGSYYSTIDIYRQMSGGRRINSAADDAAGLAVSESLKTQAASENAAVYGAQGRKDQINTKDGSMSMLTENLQRIRDLSAQASNGINSDSDRAMIQNEIGKIKESIGNDTLSSLGIADYDVSSGNADISAIDRAINSVSSSRGEMGAQSNSLDHAMAYNSKAEIQLISAQSQIEDLDYAQMSTQLKTEQTLSQIRLALQKKSMDHEQGNASRLLSMFG